MTRFIFLKTLISSVVFAKNKKSIWETPQGQYVKMLRKELERLGHWDNLDEDWQLVEDALKNGHLFFDVFPSRQEKTKMLYNLRPVFYEKAAFGGTEYVRTQLL